MLLDNENVHLRLANEIRIQDAAIDRATPSSKCRGTLKQLFSNPNSIMLRVIESFIQVDKLDYIISVLFTCMQKVFLLYIHRLHFHHIVHSQNDSEVKIEFINLRN